MDGSISAKILDSVPAKYRPAGFWVLLVCIYLLIYWPTLSFGFLTWDDGVNIFINPNLIAGNWFEFWRKPYFGFYIPMTYTFWTGLFHLNPMEAFQFRLFNLSLHMGNIILISLVLRRWQKKFCGHEDVLWMMGTALFALHPVQMEVVAWISGGRDLLAVFFVLISILCALSDRFEYRSLLSFLFFFIAVLCKPAVVALPIILFAYDIFIVRRGVRKSLVKYSLWMALPIAISVVSFSQQSGVISNSYLPFWQRLIVAMDSIGFYLAKIFLPISLATDYGRTPQYIFENLNSGWIYILFFVLLVVLLFLGLRGKNRVLVFGVFGFLVALLPVSGIVPFGFQEYSTVADRYLYFPMVFVAVAVLGIYQLQSFFRGSVIFLFTILIIAFIPLSFARIEIWGSNDLFYEDMIRKNPTSFTARMGMGELAELRKDYLRSLSLYQQAEEIRPGNLRAIDKILISKIGLGKYEELLESAKRILNPTFEAQLNAGSADARSILNSIGVAYLRSGGGEKALSCFCFLSRLDAENITYRNNLNGTSALVGKECPLRVHFSDLFIF